MKISSTKLSEAQWAKLHHRLSLDYPSSYLLLRYVCKDKLGFLARRHTEWFESQPNSLILLDWYNESKKTMFFLKYSEYLQS